MFFLFYIKVIVIYAVSNNHKRLLIMNKCLIIAILLVLSNLAEAQFIPSKFFSRLPDPNRPLTTNEFYSLKNLKTKEGFSNKGFKEIVGQDTSYQDYLASKRLYNHSQQLRLSTPTEWKWRPQVTIPIFKGTDSTRPDAKVDVSLLASTGGGISLQNLTIKASNNNGQIQNEYYCNFSWSPVTVLLSGNLTEGSTIDPSLISTVGFFNNVILLGAGFNLGEVPNDRSRFMGVFSLGINLNN